MTDHLLNFRAPLDNYGPHGGRKAAAEPGEGQLRSLRLDHERVRRQYAEELGKVERARERIARQAGPNPELPIVATLDTLAREIARLRELVRQRVATLEEIDRRLIAIANASQGDSFHG